jgi:D-psicose/D-tagatose/L-ribulose 3-epimerase
VRKVGIFYAYWVTEWEADFLPYVGKVKALGFDQLEVNGNGLVKMSAPARRELAAAARDQEIALSYGLGLSPENDVSSPDEAVRRAGIAHMRKVIEAIGEMGGGTMGGTVHSCWPQTLPRGYADKRPFRDQSLKSIRELVKIAADHRVTLCVEVINRFEQFLINTAAEAVAYVDEVGSPALGILLDTFHLNIEEDSIGGAIRLAGPRMKQLHIGETNRKPPGMGRMPWAEVRQALDDVKFEGSLVMEPFVLPGGQIGRDIGVWRPIVENPDLDGMARAAVAFTRKALC